MIVERKVFSGLFQTNCGVEIPSFLFAHFCSARSLNSLSLLLSSNAFRYSINPLGMLTSTGIEVSVAENVTTIPEGS